MLRGELGAPHRAAVPLTGPRAARGARGARACAILESLPRGPAAARLA
ncbi:hypothetical protein QJS66_22615 [Kocuria rhizophila]|nr:hypothetical protein QJS66_22615 [Kocuria rhizophila]